MKTRAAIAVAPNKPLEIHEVDLDGPRAGEVLVEIMATGVCHTDAYTLEGKDSEGIFPSILGHEGAGIVRDVGEGVTSVKVGDHVIPLYTPECRQCKSCLSRKTNLCTAIRATQGKGVMPDGTSRFRLGSETIHHYMGCSTFSNFTVMPEIAVAKVREDAPFDKICYIGCGVTTGVGAVIWTAGVEPGANVVVFGLGGIGLNVIQGAKLVGANRIVGIDVNPAKRVHGPGLRDDRLHQPRRDRHGQGGAGDPRPHRRRRRLQLRLHRQYRRDAPGARMLPPRLGGLDHHRSRRSRPRDRHPPVPARHRPGLERHAPSAAPAGRTDVPRIVDWYMDGKIEIDPLITHTMPLEDINKAFDLMHAGESIRSVVVY